MLTLSPSCEEYCNTARLGELFHGVKHCYLLPLLLPILPVTDRPTAVDSLDSHHEDSHDEKTLIMKIWFVSCTVKVCLSYPPPSCWYSLGARTTTHLSCTLSSWDWLTSPGGVSVFQHRAESRTQATTRVKQEEPKCTSIMPKLAKYIVLENEQTLKDQEMTFDWKVPSDFGGGKEKAVEVDKISLNSLDRLNAGEEPRKCFRICDRILLLLPSLHSLT